MHRLIPTNKLYKSVDVQAWQNLRQDFLATLDNGDYQRCDTVKGKWTYLIDKFLVVFPPNKTQILKVFSTARLQTIACDTTIKLEVCLDLFENYFFIYHTLLPQYQLTAAQKTNFIKKLCIAMEEACDPGALAKLNELYLFYSGDVDWIGKSLAGLRYNVVDKLKNEYFLEGGIADELDAHIGLIFQKRVNDKKLGINLEHKIQDIYIDRRFIKNAQNFFDAYYDRAFAQYEEQAVDNLAQILLETTIDYIKDEIKNIDVGAWAEDGLLLHDGYQIYLAKERPLESIVEHNKLYIYPLFYAWRIGYSYKNADAVLKHGVLAGNDLAALKTELGKIKKTTWCQRANLRETIFAAMRPLGVLPSGEAYLQLEKNIGQHLNIEESDLGQLQDVSNWEEQPYQARRILSKNKLLKVFSKKIQQYLIGAEYYITAESLLEHLESKGLTADTAGSAACQLSLKSALVLDSAHKSRDVVVGATVEADNNYKCLEAVRFRNGVTQKLFLTTYNVVKNLQSCVDGKAACNELIFDKIKDSPVLRHYPWLLAPLFAAQPSLILYDRMKKIRYKNPEWVIIAAHSLCQSLTDENNAIILKLIDTDLLALQDAPQAIFSLTNIDVLLQKDLWLLRYASSRQDDIAYVTKCCAANAYSIIYASTRIQAEYPNFDYIAHKQTLYKYKLILKERFSLKELYAVDYLCSSRAVSIAQLVAFANRITPKQLLLIIEYRKKAGLAHLPYLQMSLALESFITILETKNVMYDWTMNGYDAVQLRLRTFQDEADDRLIVSIRDDYNSGKWLLVFMRYQQRFYLESLTQCSKFFESLVVYLALCALRVGLILVGICLMLAGIYCAVVLIKLVWNNIEWFNAVLTLMIALLPLMAEYGVALQRALVCCLRSCISTVEDLLYYYSGVSHALSDWISYIEAHVNYTMWLLKEIFSFTSFLAYTELVDSSKFLIPRLYYILFNDNSLPQQEDIYIRCYDLIVSLQGSNEVSAQEQGQFLYFIFAKITDELGAEASLQDNLELLDKQYDVSYKNQSYRVSFKEIQDMPRTAATSFVMKPKHQAVSENVCGWFYRSIKATLSSVPALAVSIYS